METFIGNFGVSKEHKKISAKVIESKLIKCDDKYDVYKPVIKYRYCIGNNEFIGNIQEQENIYGTKEDMKEFLKKYPVGKTIKINVDTENPDNSYIDLGLTFQKVNPFIFIISFFLFLLLLLMQILD